MSMSSVNVQTCSEKRKRQKERTNSMISSNLSLTMPLRQWKSPDNRDEGEADKILSFVFDHAPCFLARNQSNDIWSVHYNRSRGCYSEVLFHQAKKKNGVAHMIQQKTDTPLKHSYLIQPHSFIDMDCKQSNVYPGLFCPHLRSETEECMLSHAKELTGRGNKKKWVSPNEIDGPDCGKKSEQAGVIVLTKQKIMPFLQATFHW